MLVDKLPSGEDPQVIVDRFNMLMEEVLRIYQKYPESMTSVASAYLEMMRQWYPDEEAFAKVRGISQELASELCVKLARYKR